MQESTPVYVVDGVRTPFLKARGRPGPFSASDLAVAAGRPLLSRNPIERTELDEVILGCAMPSVDEANIGRIVALRLGCGKSVPGWTVMRNCASAMQALDSARVNIITGRASLVLAGGTEAMSRAPVLYGPKMVEWLADMQAAKTPAQRAKAFFKLRPGHFAPVIGLLRGLSDPMVGLSMGQTAEIVAHRFGVTREQMDAYAARSHHRLAAAIDAGHLGDEVATVYGPDGSYHEHDDGLRRDSSPEKLATLRPFFDRDVGLVTPGNSSQVTDGAALLLLASGEAVEQRKLPVLGRIVGCEWAALDPAEMGLGPVHAIAQVLDRHGLTLDDIDYFEINEAFAGQVIGCIEALASDAYCREELGRDGAVGRIDEDKLNIDGGAVAIGHPVGASGARVALHALNVLKRTGGRYAIATLCIGGGQGGAMLLERA
ncbi:MAG: acetyl-CoA C-acetyltransferase [Xanthomonadaceae bacterium]|nr:acetyl-CoA C-acetyltransferase [Xanthomonadaceae bacterium]